MVADDDDRTRLLRGLAHELANAGNGLGVSIELLRLLLDSGELAAARDALAQLMRGCQRVNGIAGALRAVSIDCGALRPQAVSCHALLQRLEHDCRPAAAAHGIDLGVTADSDDMRLHCDGQAVAMTLRQLVDNALGFAARRIRVDATRDGDAAVVRVTDDGHGVAPALRPRLFTMFVSSRRDDGHPGLGLWHAFQVCRAQGIDLDCLDPGPGATTFALRIPAPAVVQD